MEKKFDPVQKRAAQEAPKSTGNRIIKAEDPMRIQVDGYSARSVHEQGFGEYGSAKSKFGPLAATDAERSHRAWRDSRFQMSPIVKERLGISSEERRIIDERVEAELSALREEAREQAHAEGLAQGREEGKAEALAAYQTEAAEKIEKIHALTREFEALRASIYEANERMLVDLMFRLSRMLFLKELPQDRQYVLRLAKNLVERVGTRENIRLRLSRRDLELLDELHAGLSKEFANLTNLSIEVDPQVRGGGVHLETRWNAIDASVDTQLEKIFEALFGSGSANVITGGGADPVAAISMEAGESA
jgi:flagellar assembly protein FliH